MFLLTTATSKATSLALPIYLVFLVAVIICGIYVLIYRRNLNKALKENNGRHVNLPDIRSVIIFILVVVLFYGVFSTKSLIKDMKEQMEYMESEMSYKFDCLDSDIENLQLQLIEIQNADKLVSYFSYSIDSFDMENMTVTYILEAELKSYSDDTKVSINVDRELIQLTKDANGMYVGKVIVGMFETFEGMAEIYIEEGETTTSETLDYVVFSNGWTECLPSIGLFTLPNYKYDADKKKLTFDPALEITVNTAMAGTFTDIYLEIDMKGEDVKKVEIISNANLLSTKYDIDLNKYLPEVYSASVMKIYVVGVDSLGYTHKNLVISWEDGDIHWREGMSDIYDKDGNKLTEN